MKIYVLPETRKNPHICPSSCTRSEQHQFEGATERTRQRRHASCSHVVHNQPRCPTVRSCSSTPLAATSGSDGGAYGLVTDLHYCLSSSSVSDPLRHYAGRGQCILSATALQHHGPCDHEFSFSGDVMVIGVDHR